MPRLRTLFLVLGAGAWLLPCLADQVGGDPAASVEVVFGIPLKPDPPFAIDGDLGEWGAVPHPMSIDARAQVIYGPGAWQSPADLSGLARIAWRHEFLFLAVSVTDDQLVQTQRGANLWKGDHVELYVDAQPDQDPGRDAYGAGQFQIAFSPGNFLATGDPLTDCPPEVYQYRPSDSQPEGALVAAKRTPNGWTLEAAVPWRALGVENPDVGLPLRFEIAISDTDSATPQQESMMTVSTAPWGHTRSRLMLAALAGADGVASPMMHGAALFDRVELANGTSQEFHFAAPNVPAGREAILALQARMETPKVAGFTPALRLTLNGTPIAAERLTNKPLRAASRGGQEYSMAAGERFSTFYSPDFNAPDTHPYYGLLDGIKACAFEFKISDVLRPGENVLVVANGAAPTVPNPMIAGEGHIEFRVPPPPPKPRAGPPTGPLPHIVPESKFETAYDVRELPEAQIEISVGGETFMVESQFSTPKPGWVTGSSEFAALERRIERRPEAIIVYDTFVNKTSANLPLMHRRQMRLGDQLAGLWLGGLKQPTKNGTTAEPQNPTTYAATSRAGLGLLPLDDVFRVHTTNFAAGGIVGLADNNLVLPPQATYTAVWAIVPTESPDYWWFINAARRLVDANFTIDGGFAFLRADSLTEPWSDQQTIDFIRFKDAEYVCASISYPKYKGRYTHGTAFQQVTHDNYRAAVERRRRLVPGVVNLVYFHCFIDVTDEAPERFADSRTLGPDGRQMDYGEPYDRLFFPTETNAFGAAIAKNVDIIFDEIGADGVYWDEHEYSRCTYHYGEPWDGWSGDIDPVTMKLVRLKSSVTLLSEPWRVALAKRILARGALVGNGVPVTRAMAALKFPCFVETGSITNCRQAHLYSPVALGDHLTERNEEDAYHTMLAALDHGCVYHWYHDVQVVPTHHHLTRYMFPITPLEIHGGYIIGEERIVTNRSGLFGWGDGSGHEVHVFDEHGREVGGDSAASGGQDYYASALNEAGNTFTELRLAEGWSAAIIRQTQAPKTREAPKSNEARK